MHLVNLLLSSALFVSGSYIGFRGWERMNTASKANSHSGMAEARSPLESHLTKERCIYSHLVVEYYQPGSATNWAVAIDMKRDSPFGLGGGSFNPGNSEIDAKPVQVVGYLQRGAGALDEFITRSMVASANRPIDPRIAANLLSSIEVKSRLAPHMKKILRITETVIPEQAEIFVLAKPPKNQHEASKPILISTAPGAKAIASLTRTAYVGMGLGAALIAAALAIILFL